MSQNTYIKLPTTLDDDLKKTINDSDDLSFRISKTDEDVERDKVNHDVIVSCLSDISKQLKKLNIMMSEITEINLGD